MAVNESENIRDIITLITIKEPILGLYLRRTWIYYNDEIEDVAYTDGLRIFLGKQFFRKSEHEKISILGHEAIHIILKHCERGLALAKKGVPQIISNIAGDVKANQTLREAGFKIPEGAVTMEMVNEWLRGKAEVTSDMSMEEIAELLLKKLMEKAEAYNVIMDLKGGKEEKRGRVLNSGDEDEEKIEDESEKAAKAERKAVEIIVANTSAGRKPAWATIVLDEILKPKLNWKRLLRRALSKGIGKKVKRTWTRPSRKYSLFPGKELLKSSDIIVLMDTSGSIDIDTLKQFMGEVYAIAHESSNIYVLMFDATVYEPIRIDRPSDIKKIKITGRGGTMINDALKLLSRRYDNAEEIVILSDWDIADLDEDEVEEKLRRYANRIIAVTTLLKPPEYIKNTVRLEVKR
jgi:predicted metal-dependent peptidase